MRHHVITPLSGMADGTRLLLSMAGTSTARRSSRPASTRRTRPPHATGPHRNQHSALHIRHVPSRCAMPHDTMNRPARGSATCPRDRARPRRAATIDHAAQRMFGAQMMCGVMTDESDDRRETRGPSQGQGRRSQPSCASARRHPPTSTTRATAISAVKCIPTKQSMLCRRLVRLCFRCRLHQQRHRLPLRRP